MTSNQSTEPQIACDIPNVALQDLRRYGVAIYQLSDFMTSVTAKQADDALLAAGQQRLVKGVELVSVYLRIHPEFAPFRDALTALACDKYCVCKAKWNDVRAAIS